MAAGSVIGELLHIHAGLERSGNRLKSWSGNSGDRGFAETFVTASLTVCIGAMTVIGAVEDGISGNCDILAVKAVLDCIICIMAAGMGKGSSTALAHYSGPALTPGMPDNLSYTGSLLIFCTHPPTLSRARLELRNSQRLRS